jgi:hypothetical protein
MLRLEHAPGRLVAAVTWPRTAKARSSAVRSFAKGDTAFLLSGFVEWTTISEGRAHKVERKFEGAVYYKALYIIRCGGAQGVLSGGLGKTYYLIAIRGAAFDNSEHMLAPHLQRRPFLVGELVPLVYPHDPPTAARNVI